MSIDAEIFEVTETFHLVEVKMCNGYTMDYQRLVDEDLRPALGDNCVGLARGERERTAEIAENKSIEINKKGTIVKN